VPGFVEALHPRGPGGKFRASLASRARKYRQAGAAKLAAFRLQESARVRTKLQQHDVETERLVADAGDKAGKVRAARDNRRKAIEDRSAARLDEARKRIRASVRYEHELGKLRGQPFDVQDRAWNRWRKRKAGERVRGNDALKAAIARARAAKKPPTAPKSPSAGKFEDAKHPRGQGGKFRDTGGGSRRKGKAGGKSKAQGDRRHKALERAVDRARAAREKIRSHANQDQLNAATDRVIAAVRAAHAARMTRAKELVAERRNRGAAAKPAPNEGKMQAARDRYEARLAAARKESALAKVRTGATNADRHRAVRIRGVKPTSQPERQPERGAGFIGEIPAKDVHFDPARFQYKLATTDSHTGSVGSLAGVKKWDKELAGVVGVWKDPSNGKTFVVNGHNRLDLANKLGVDKVAVRYLDAPTAEMARAKGALANIAEGRGTSVDAAKFFRDSGIKDVQSLQDRGIPLAEGKTREGLALAGLANPLFRRVIDGTLPIDKAALIGGGGLSDSQQMQLGKLLDKQKGRATSAQVREWVDEAKAAGERKRDSGPGLFGDAGADDEALFLHRTALNAHVAERLSREKKLFGTVARKRSADELSRGGNVIDSEASGKISRDASEALAVFSQLKRTSVFAGATQAATLRMADAKNDRERAQIRDEYYTEVKKRVRDAYNLGK